VDFVHRNREIPFCYPKTAERPFDWMLAAWPLLVQGAVAAAVTPVAAELSAGGFGRGAAVALVSAVAGGVVSSRFERRRAARGEIQSLRSELVSATALPLAGFVALAVRLAAALPGSGLAALPLPPTVAPLLAGFALGALPTLGRAGVSTWVPSLLGSAVALLAFVFLCFPGA